MEGLTKAAAAAAGDGWSERMDREPDSHAQLSAGSKKERLTPGQRDMARERRRGDRKIESSFQIAAGLAVCTHRAFRVKVNRSFKSGTLFRTDGQPQRALSPSRPPGLDRAVQLEVTVLTAASFRLLRLQRCVFTSQRSMSGSCKAFGLNGYEPITCHMQP